MPAKLTAVVAKVKELQGQRRLPAGIDPAKFAALSGEIGGWETSWKTAVDGFAAGNLAEALTQGRDVAAKVAAAMAMFGMS